MASVKLDVSDLSLAYGIGFGLTSRFPNELPVFDLVLL